MLGGIDVNCILLAPRPEFKIITTEQGFLDLNPLNFLKGELFVHLSTPAALNAAFSATVGIFLFLNEWLRYPSAFLKSSRILNFFIRPSSAFIFSRRASKLRLAFKEHYQSRDVFMEVFRGFV